MEKEILEGPIGSVGSYDLAFKGGFLSLTIGAKPGFGVEADMVVKVGADTLIDAMAAAIPGSVDDAIFAVLKQALKL